jgi:hypothetical protein
MVMGLVMFVGVELSVTAYLRRRTGQALED